MIISDEIRVSQLCFEFSLLYFLIYERMRIKVTVNMILMILAIYIVTNKQIDFGGFGKMFLLNYRISLLLFTLQLHNK